MKKITAIIDLPQKLLFLTITYLFTLISFTVYKGAVWGVMAPTAGISALFGIEAIWKRRFDHFKMTCYVLRAVVIIGILLGVHYYMQPEPIVANDNISHSPIVTPNTKIGMRNVALESEGAKLIQWPSAASLADVYFLGIYMPWFIVPSDHTLVLKPRESCTAQTDWECCFQFNGSEGVMIIDLGKDQPVEKISMIDTFHHPPKDFSIFGSADSVDSSSWFSLGTFSRDCSLIDIAKPQTILTESAPRKIRYLKLDVKNNCGGVQYTTLCTINVYVMERANDEF